MTTLVSIHHYWPGSSYERFNLKSMRCCTASLTTVSTNNPSIDSLIYATANGGDVYLVVSPNIQNNLEIESLMLDIGKL